MNTFVPRCGLCAALTLLAPAATRAHEAAPAAAPQEAPREAISLVFRDTPIGELFAMIARMERINIVLGHGVTGNVSINLYQISMRQAIYAIAEAGGYGVMARDNGYFIRNPKDEPVQQAAGRFGVRALKVEYSDPKPIADILERHLSPGAKITVLEQRRMLVVEETAEGLARIQALLAELDAQPRQIMIEAKILEITLDQSENFGVDWSRVMSADGVNRIGVTGLAARGASGLVFNLVNRNIELYLNALSNKGKVRTLATPKLLTLEHREAVANIGDKLGYKLTTTINNVTSESVQFLDTGVILRVTPSVDASGRILMKIRPEVSSGSVSAGIPSKKTTEVSTQLVADDGQSILIAGLIKRTGGYRRTGVPLLGELPLLGRLFSSSESSAVSSETIVVITPRIVPIQSGEMAPGVARAIDEADSSLLLRSNQAERALDALESAPLR
jgi:type II secretory pathway component GspD/PulD (secretin)